MKKFLLALIAMVNVTLLSGQIKTDLTLPSKLVFEADLALYQNNNILPFQITNSILDKSQKSLTFISEEKDLMEALTAAKRGDAIAETLLLQFIENNPHSYALSYAKVALGEFYFNKKDYRSSAYWFSDVDLASLPEDIFDSSNYYLGYSLIKDGRESQALKVLKPLSYSPNYGHEASYYAGYIEYKQKHYSEALKLWEKIETNPIYSTYVDAYKGEILLSQNKYTDALKVSQKILANKSNKNDQLTSSALRVAGISSSMLGDSNAAINYLSRYKENTSTPGRLELITLGRELNSVGRYSESLTYLNSVADGTKDYMSQLALYYKGLSLLSLNRTQEAYNAFVQSSEIDVFPSLTHATAYNAALTLYNYHQGEVGPGTIALSEYITKYPNSEFSDNAVKYLSEAYSRTQNPQQALQELDRITPLPNSLLVTKQKVSLNMANKLMGSGNTQEAYRQYDEIISSNKDPESVAQALLWKGELAYREGKYSDAVKYIEDYLIRKPNTIPVNGVAYYNLGYSYYNLENWSKSEDAFISFLNTDDSPTSIEKTDVYNRLGDIAQMRRDYNQAYNYYSNAINAKGKSSDYAILKTAIIHGLRKDYKAKARDLDNLIREYPNSQYVPEALYEKGRALTFIDQTDLAQEDFNKVFNTFRNSSFAPKAGVQLALVYFNRNNLEKAADTYIEVIKRYPKSESAQSALQDLKSISVDLNRVDEYTQLASIVGQDGISFAQTDSLTFLAAERLLSQGKKDQALAAMKNYTEQYPNGKFVDQANYHQAYLLYQSRKFKSALPILEALEKKNNSSIQTDVLKMLSQTYEQINEYGRAAETYLKLARKSTTKREIEAALDASSQMAQKSNSDDFILAMANDINRGGINAHNMAGPIFAHASNILLTRKDFGAALEYANLALSKGAAQYTAKASVVKATVLYEQNNLNGAKNVAEKIVQSGNSDAYWLSRAFIVLSDIAIKQGDKTTALEYLNGVKSNYSNRKDGILDEVDKRLQSIK